MPEDLVRQCPQCGYEYEPWVEICPDCGVLIESVPAIVEALPDDESPRLDPNENPRWTVVSNAPNAIIGNLLKSQLEDAGIPVVMMRAPSADIAQFSGNDYVPYDLRVPFHRLADARRLLDSRPDRTEPTTYFRSALGMPPTAPGELAEQEDGEEGTPSLPEGWRMLPTERDVRARQSLQRSHGEEYAGDSGWESDYGDDPDEWHWVGRDGSPAPGVPASTALSSRRDFDEPDDYRTESYDSYGPEDYWDSPNRWIRVVYGILLAALSIPFIFQVLGQIASAFGFSK